MRQAHDPSVWSDVDRDTRVRPPDRGGHREHGVDVNALLNISAGAVRVARHGATGPLSTHVQLESDRPRLRVAGAGICEKCSLRAAVEDLARVEDPVDGGLAVEHDVHRHVHAPRRDGDGDGEVSWVFVVVHHEVGSAALAPIRRIGLRGGKRWVRRRRGLRGEALAGRRARRPWWRRWWRRRSGITCDLGLLVDARRREPEAVVLVPRPSQFERDVASAGPDDVRHECLLDHWRRERLPVEREDGTLLPIGNHDFELEPRAPLPGDLERHAQTALAGGDASRLQSTPTAKVTRLAAAIVAVIRLVVLRAKGVALRRLGVAGAAAPATG